MKDGIFKCAFNKLGFFFFFPKVAKVSNMTLLKTTKA